MKKSEEELSHGDHAEALDTGGAALRAYRIKWCSRGGHTACLGWSKMPFEPGLAPREASQTAHEPLSSTPSAPLCPTLRLYGRPRLCESLTDDLDHQSRRPCAPRVRPRLRTRWAKQTRKRPSVSTGTARLYKVASAKFRAGGTALSAGSPSGTPRDRPRGPGVRGGRRGA